MLKVKKLTLKSPDFPEALRQIPSPPKQLFVIGNLSEAISLPSLAVVGARKITPYGRDVTTKLVQEVASKGITIISGLALGVDGVAHESSLDAGGKTIAVLPCGLGKIYPSTHHHLARRIISSGGAIISEYPDGTEPFKTNFIERNRLVSGLSDGVLITEAAERSGTLHTANFALDQGKTVMAVPGNITSPMSKGTNALLKMGATPITQAADVLEALGFEQKVSAEQPSLFGANEAETIILNLLKDGLSDVTELQRDSNLSASEFNQTMTMLEINGRIKSLGAGQWSLK